MSTSEIEETYTYDEPATFTISERGAIKIEGCPPSIEKQLQRASFEAKAANVFVKTQSELGAEGSEYRVVRVTLDGPVMHVDVRDSVGIVSLTPRTNLQIQPKIDWDDVFDMLLAVHGRKRAVEYQGIPMTDLQSGDADLKDVFLLLAINYLNALEVVHRNGFVRRLETHREDLEQPRGVIDITESLINQAEGRTAQHCLLKRVNYDNPANSLLHYAGQHLLRLFQRYEDEYDHHAYYRIFSEVHEEVRHLERLDVTSNRRRMSEYQRFSLHDLPKQRHYYEQAIEVAKAIASSSLGTPAMEGTRELMVDYVLNMESLFEQYSQVAIERQLEAIKGYDRIGVADNVSAASAPTITPFEAEPQIHHQPDHAIEEGEKTLAVLDSKYYAEGKDPVKSGGSRSRLFAYAYLLDTTRLGFLTILNEPRKRTVAQTGAELEVVAPEGDQFELDAYHSALRDYLHSVLSATYPVMEVFRAVEQQQLCLDQYDASDLDRIADPDGPFDFSNQQEFSLRVINAAADSHSRQVASRSDLEQRGKWTRSQIESRCDDRSSDDTTCVPVFRRGDSGEENIDLYFISRDDTDVLEVELEGGFSLL
jgi:5-methylcytosine-specific restriction endonuclease McrBC regulatory subunit McrC